MLRNPRALEIRAFDGDAARTAFDQLPNIVTVYRVTVAADGRRFGICWSMQTDKAAFFAFHHDRFRNTKSRARTYLASEH